MATQGPFKVFNRAKLKVLDATLSLKNDAFKAVLCASTQSLDETFTGSSADCRYADLTAELATANGYANGGLAAASVTLTRTTTTHTNHTAAWDIPDPGWTLTRRRVAF